MNINWKVRFKSKAFWLAAIPLALLLVQQVAAIFGFALSFDELQSQLLAVVGTVFGILALLGVIVDPTTKGFSDSERALSYDSPYDGGRAASMGGGMAAGASGAADAAAKKTAEHEGGMGND